MNTNKTTVLVVDNDRTTREQLEQEIARGMYNVQTTSEGRTAIEIIRRSEVGIILVDINLPDINGIEFIRKVKEIAPGCELIVIIGTAPYSGWAGGGNIDLAIEALRSGAIDYIEKPINMDRFHTVMGRAQEKLQEATEQLIQTAKLSALGELTAGVAHELNQPLNGIKIICQSIIKDIQKNRYSTEELQTDLADIVEQVDKMAAIIDHMRIFTRRSEGMNTELIDINTVVEGTFKLLNQQLKDNGITVTKNLAPDLPQVKGDIIRLEQVCINLIINAKNAMTKGANAGKDLKITTYQTNNCDLPSCNGTIVVEIEDNGTGIPESIIDKIFQPFFTTNEHGKGTGLGLSVSKKIINEHGGKISVQSDVGRATIFKLTLPIADK
ncbi:MAG: response regulator [Nitrospirae bacterium]|nr:response regulator [Nitrospirota bacterium]MBF0592500.1 response regulator [Nitrospirota bacterium]